MTKNLTKIAWRRSQSLYNYGPASAIHLLAEGTTKTLCGVEVPAHALTRPERALWFEVNAVALDVTDESEFEEPSGENSRRDCQRCAKKAGV